MNGLNESIRGYGQDREQEFERLKNTFKTEFRTGNRTGQNDH